MEEKLYIESVNSLMNGELSFDEKLGNFALGLVCETGEVLDAILQNNSDKVKDELSDCRWYLTASAILIDLQNYINSYDLSHKYYMDEDNRSTRLIISAAKYGDMIKKVIYHKHPLEQHHNDLKTLLFRYYVNYRKMLQQFNLTDEQIKQYNYEKLNARYKGLKFTTDQSINRVNELQINS